MRATREKNIMIEEFIVWYYDPRGAWRESGTHHAELILAQTEAAEFTLEKLDWYIEKRVRSIVAKHHVNDIAWNK